MSRSALLRRLFHIADLGAGLVIGAITGRLLALGGGAHAEYAALAGLLWLALCSAAGLSAQAELRSWASGVPDAGRLVTAAVIMSWLLPTLGVVVGAGFQPAVALAALGLALTSGLLRGFVRAFVHGLAPLRQRTLIVGSGRVAAQVVDALGRHSEASLEPVGIVDDRPYDLAALDLPWLGRVDQLPRLLCDETIAIDRVIFAFSRTRDNEMLAGVRACRDAGVPVDIVPRLFEFLDCVQPMDGLGGLPLLSIGASPLGPASRAAKRALDLAGAGAGLIVLAPLLAAVAAAIKLTSRGPVFFRQPRAGRGGQPFRVWKFRSMHLDADARKADFAAENEHGDGLMFKIRRDPRTTPVGWFLRRTSLDELPQLINVMRGEMSLVGPRPLIYDETAHLVDDWHRRRFDLRPGITGLWQISGRSELPFREMVRLDYQYVAGWSVARDLQILLATVPVVLTGRGAY